MTEPRLERTIAFVDLAGFTALAEAHGDQDAARVARHLTEATRAAIPAEVQLIKTLGDAVMLASPGPEAMLSGLDRIATTLAATEDYPDLRAGLHHGSVAELDGDHFGRTVNLAARVAALAGAGEAILTAVVAEVATGIGLRVQPLGLRRIRNIPEPVELFLLPLTGAEGRVVDPVCRMQLDPARAPIRRTVDGTLHRFCSSECAEKFTDAPFSYL